VRWLKSGMQQQNRARGGRPWWNAHSLGVHSMTAAAAVAGSCRANEPPSCAVRHIKALGNGFDSPTGRQNLAFSRAYLSQTQKNCPLSRKGFFQEFPNLIRILMRPGVHVMALWRSAFWWRYERWTRRSECAHRRWPKRMWIPAQLCLLQLSR